MSTPEALQLAAVLQEMRYVDMYRCQQAADMLRAQATEIERLTAERDAIRALLPDELYAGSKDWAQGDLAQRVDFLKTWRADAQAEARVAYLAFEQLTAERDALREAGRLALAWFDAENNHTGTTFWERVEMCRAAEGALRAALQQPKEPSTPKGLARSDADYWIRSRAAILQAIADRGLMLVSNKDGFCLMEAGKMQAQTKEPSNV